MLGRLRSGIVVALVSLSAALVPATARAEPYVSLDAGFVYSSGGYHWNSPPLFGKKQVTLDSTVSGYGGALEGSVGYSQRWFSAGVEASGAFLATSSNGLRWSTIKQLVNTRFGGRIEARCKFPLYARASFGTQWSVVYGDTADVYAADNVWNPENARGLYGALGIGVRLSHWGLLTRVDLAKLTSDHASYTPVTFFLGADVSWF